MLNARTLNTETLDAELNAVITNYNGTETDIEQILSIQYSGSLITIEQTQQFLATVDSSSLVTIEQSVRESLASSALINIEQNQRVVSTSTYYSRNGWQPFITINGGAVPDNQITGVCTFTHSESNSALFDFSIIPPVGVQDIFAYQGKTVTCDVKVAAGTFRIFTGKIDIPEIDVMNERITFRCSDNREEHLALGHAGSTGAYGNYSTTVFGEIVDTKQEMLERLSTIPYSLDWDGYGNAYLTSWTPKATADYTLGDSSIYRRTPSIRIESRAQITNRVDINFTYNYQRFHHAQIAYSWAVPYTTYTFLTTSPSLCRRQMVQQAADAAGWPIRGQIGYTDILAPGYYTVNGVTVAWSTGSTQGQTIPRLDPSGNPVLDTQGKPIYDYVPTYSEDVSVASCFGAAWNATKRWSQNISETYTISVTAPQSTARYGTVTKAENSTFTDIDNSAQWESYNAYKDPPAGSGITDETYYIDNTLTISEFNNATSVLINRAKTTILQAHRDSRVNFEVFIWPQIDLRHTVALTAGRIACKGKVVKITHEFDCRGGEGRTEVELALFRETGAQSESSLVPPTRPTDEAATPYSGIPLGSHYGEDPTTAAAQLWTGHIGNQWIVVQEGQYFDHRRTTYQESFVVDTPAIADRYRSNRVLTSSQTYNIAIPTDNLVWTTLG